MMFVHVIPREKRGLYFPLVPNKRCAEKQERTCLKVAASCGEGVALKHLQKCRSIQGGADRTNRRDVSARIWREAENAGVATVGDPNILVRVKSDAARSAEAGLISGDGRDRSSVCVRTRREDRDFVRVGVSHEDTSLGVNRHGVGKF